MKAGLPPGWSFRYRISRPSMRQLWQFQTALRNPRSSRFGATSMRQPLCGCSNRAVRLPVRQIELYPSQFGSWSSPGCSTYRFHHTRNARIVKECQFCQIKMATSGHPSPSTIREARRLLGITQSKAAEMVHSTCRVWQQWEAGDRKMHPAFWELFQIKSMFNARMSK